MREGQISICARDRVASAGGHEDKASGRRVETLAGARESGDMIPQLAAACVLSDYVEHNAANAYLLNPVLFSRRGNTLSCKEWLSFCFHDAEGMINRQLEQLTGCFISGAYTEGQVAEYKTVLSVVASNAAAISAILDRVLGCNLLTCKWVELVHCGLSPYAASLFITVTREDEHIVLTERMLTWLRTCPGSIPKNVACDVPVCAPRDATRYRILEYWCRRSQRAIWPGLTSRQCGILINSSGAI